MDVAAWSSTHSFLDWLFLSQLQYFPTSTVETGHSKHSLNIVLNPHISIQLADLNTHL